MLSVCGDWCVSVLDACIMEKVSGDWCLCNVCALWCGFVEFLRCILFVSEKYVYSGVCVSIVSGVCLRYVHCGLCVDWVEGMVCLCVRCVHCRGYVCCVYV